MLALAKKMNDNQSSTSNCDAESKSEHDKVLEIQQINLEIE
jgi:hypothetical protein